MMIMNTRLNNLKMISLIKSLFVAFSLLLVYPVFASEAEAATNLVANPGFESGSTTPSSWRLVTVNGIKPIWDTVAHSGARSIKISIPGTTLSNSGYPLSDKIIVEPLRNYTLSAWVKSESVRGGPTVRVVQYDANWNSLRQINLEFSRGTSDWTQKQMDFQTLSNTAHVLIYAYIYNGYGSFWIDDIELSLKAAPTSTSSPTPTSTPIPTSDTTFPTITINSPLSSQMFSTSTITISGTASDNIGISKVEVRVGSGALQTASGTTSWGKSVTLASGSNTIYARATDTSGNFKETSVTVTYDSSNPSGGIYINSDKTLSVNGKKTFPVFMYSICDGYYEIHNGGMVEPCDPSENSEFLFSGAALYYQHFDRLDYKNKFEQTGIFYNLYAKDINSIPQELKSSSAFLGYYQLDEPADDKLDTVKSNYNNVKAKDNKHPVILNHWENMMKWSPYTDIITWDAYTIQSTSWWTRQDSIYAYEQGSEQNFFKGTNLNSISKPVWAVLQANGVPCCRGLFVPIPREVRANTYTAITMDVKGIGYWGYKSWGSSEYTSVFPNGTSGLYNKPELHAYYRQLARELTDINDILVLPTKDYSWHYRPGTMVSFSKSLSKTVLWKARTNFNYILKQSGGTTYLIVVNKDSRPISDVKITISGLIGTKTAKTLGLETSGSGRAGRVLNVNNGLFTDSFDGYGVHIYKIS